MNPFDVAMAERAAASSARVEKRLAELERRPKTVSQSPEFVRMANRMTDLRPVRIGLAVALRRGKKAYVTVLNGVPIAFTEKGWLTQEQVNAKLEAEAIEQDRREVTPVHAGLARAGRAA
jgi:hypothetical protein